MEKDGDRGRRRLKSGLSRAELILGFSESVPSHAEDEILKELKEEEVMWEEDENKAGSSFEADVCPVIQLRRSTHYRGTTAGRELSEFPLNHSAPVNVPLWPRDKSAESFSAREDEGEKMSVPPHELVAYYNNNNNNNISFSVVEGIGRTLKGRDLRKVRDAVFRRTGLLD